MVYNDAARCRPRRDSIFSGKDDSSVSEEDWYSWPFAEDYFLPHGPVVTLLPRCQKRSPLFGLREPFVCVWHPCSMTDDLPWSLCPKEVRISDDANPLDSQLLLLNASCIYPSSISPWQLHILCGSVPLDFLLSILPSVTALKSEFPVTDPLSLSLLSNVARKNWGRVFSLMIFIEFGHFPFIYVF